MNKWWGSVQPGGRDHCVLCGAGPAAGGLCAGCLDDLPWLGTCCAACGVPLTAEGLCGRCRRDGPFPYRVTAALAYRCPVNALITAFKFHGGLVEGRVLAELFADHLGRRVTEPPDLLVPVPLHPARLRVRGYNQAAVLARALGRRLGIAVAGAGFRRIRDTSPQSRAEAVQGRVGNVRGAFICQRDLTGMAVAMVDDVVTSGATARAFGDVLQGAGASRVECYCCARTPK